MNSFMALWKSVNHYRDILYKLGTGGGGGRRLRRGKREILAIWAEWEDEGEGRRRGLGRGKREIIAVEYKMVWMRV